MLPYSTEQIEEASRRELSPSAFEEGFRLYESQCRSLDSFRALHGVFVPIGVGFGKGLVSIKLCEIAWSEFGARRVVLMVPPRLLAQTFQRLIPWCRNKFPVSFPVYNVGNPGLTHSARVALAAHREGVFVVPYSLLSTMHGHELVEALAPNVVICDEAHMLANRKKSARSKLFAKLVDTYVPKCCFLSGTMTKKSIMDYYHLITWSLRHHSPLPLAVSTAEEWAAVLDANAALLGGGRAGPIDLLVEWARLNHAIITKEPYKYLDEYTISSFREAHQIRLHSAHGVVSSGDNDIGTSLVIHFGDDRYEGSYKPDARLLALMHEVERGQTPDGDEIEWQIHKFKWLSELTTGGYNSLYWPDIDYIAERWKCSESKAEELLERAQAHHVAKQAYTKAVRMWLDMHDRPGLMMPMQLVRSMNMHGAKEVGQDLYDLRNDMLALEFAGMPERLKRYVRVDDYKIKAMLDWYLNDGPPGAFVWYRNIELGIWAYEAARQAGIDVVAITSDTKDDSLLHDPNIDGKLNLATWARGLGTDGLQERFFRQWFLQVPRSASDMQQIIGRLHRPGQLKDEIVVNLMMSTDHDSNMYAALLNEAAYCAHMDARQRVLYADYTSAPRILNVETLRALGASPKQLSPQQWRILQETFGT